MKSVVRVPDREELTHLRTFRRMTREQIAVYFDVSIATVGRWIKQHDIPRPKKVRDPRILNHGELVSEPDLQLTTFEIAQIVLSDRLIEKRGCGYYLDGRPAKIDAILAAAGLSP